MANTVAVRKLSPVDFEIETFQKHCQMEKAV